VRNVGFGAVTLTSLWRITNATAAASIVLTDVLSAVLASIFYVRSRACEAVSPSDLVLTYLDITFMFGFFKKNVQPAPNLSGRLEHRPR
jgi:hypothetical protein